MRCVKLKLSEDHKTLHVTLDVSGEGEPSSSGKSRLICSTQGNVDLGAIGIPAGKLGLNLYRMCPPSDD